MKYRSFLLLLILLFYTHSLLVGQQNQVGSIHTSGECSPVVVGGSPTITCPDRGLTKLQAETLAKQYAEVINHIRRESLDIAKVLSQLKDMASDLHDVAQATRQRHLSNSEKAQLKEFFSTISHSGTIVFFAQTGEEPTTFAQDFVDVYNEVEPHSGYSVGLDVGARRGIRLTYNNTDVREGTVPERCTQFFSLLKEKFHIDVINVSSGMPVRGNCWLHIGSK